MAKIQTGDSSISKQKLYQLSYRNLVTYEGGKFWYIAADLGPVLVDTRFVYHCSVIQTHFSRVAPDRDL